MYRVPSVAMLGTTNHKPLRSMHSFGSITHSNIGVSSANSTAEVHPTRGTVDVLVGLVTTNVYSSCVAVIFHPSFSSRFSSTEVYHPRFSGALNVILLSLVAPLHVN